MKKFRRMTVALLTLLISFVFVPVAFAHPLGNFTINHYAGLLVSRDTVAIDFVIDMAEIPAFQEISTFDTNGNGKADSSEAEAYHAEKCKSLQSDLSLLLNNKALGLTLASSSVEFPVGAGGLPTLRLTCEFSASVANAKQIITSLAFADDSYSERIGWREIVVTSEGIPLKGDFSSTSISNRLTSYPKDLLSSPLDQRRITLGIGSFTAAKQNTSVNTTQPVPSLAGSRSDPFTQLITLDNLTLSTVLFALLISFIWGAMHALTPGHGKAVVGSYLIGERGNARHALLLGLTTTITHTAGVFAMGLVTLLAAQFITPEQLFPWLSFLSGALVAGIGLRLMITRLRDVRRPRSFEMAHEHQHDFIHKHEHHVHDDHSHDHSHDGHTHSHLPPGADGQAVTWKSILALGISGGILPCPSALIVLLSAIALGRVGFGLALVLAFSAGLAGVLTAIGLLFVYAGRMIQFAPKQRWVLRALPVASALVISLAGLGITVRALSQIGWIRL